MTKKYRPGAIGALADEYERVLEELKTLIGSIPPEVFNATRNEHVEEEFRSCAGISMHVVRSGYVYADHIRKRFNETVALHDIQVGTPEQAITELGRLFAYTLETFEGKWEMTDEALLSTWIRTSWSAYDLEALIEHAVLHIMRHRRQMEKLLAS